MLLFGFPAHLPISVISRDVLQFKVRNRTAVVVAVVVFVAVCLLGIMTHVIHRCKKASINKKKKKFYPLFKICISLNTFTNVNVKQQPKYRSYQLNICLKSLSVFIFSGSDRSDSVTLCEFR